MKLKARETNKKKCHVRSLLCHCSTTEHLQTKQNRFDVHGSAHRKRISKYDQQPATLRKLFISVKCSTRFRRSLPPIIRSPKTVYTASGTLSNLYCYLPLSSKRWNWQWQVAVGVWQSTQVLYIYSFWAPDDGRRNRLKHAQHFTEINKLCNDASCWLYLEKRNRRSYI